ncbi:hypothetical protein HDU67_009732 [Dinochytrium kinnereticum]|nr:hypothetical protein HDU67_009732 [Dinochytrium kinnereticum]
MTDDAFKPKRAQLDWDRIGRIDIDALISDDAKLEEELESLYPVLVKAAVSLDDPKANPNALLKLFRLTQLTMELKNMYLESAESQIQTLEETVKTQTTEISRLKSRTSGNSGLPPSSELRAIREENIDLERRNELLARDLQRAEDSLEKELKFNQELNANLTEEKQRYAHLVESTRQLENDMKERETQMLTHQQRLLSKNAEEEEFRAQLKEKNNEINKCLTEIKKLSIQNAELQNDVDTMTQELEATVAELERNAREQESTQQLLISNDIMIDELTEERDSLKIKVEELSEQIHERDINEGVVVGKLKEQLYSTENRLRETESSLKAAQNKNSRLTSDITNLKDELQLCNSDSIRKELIQRDEIIAGLRSKLEESYRDFEMLSLDWDRIDSLMKGKSGMDIDALKSQALIAKKLQEKVDALRGRRSADADHMATLKIQIEEKERENMEMKDRLDAYERGVFGLKEAIKEVKDLKLQRSIRDKEIAALTKQINDFEAQVSDMVDENAELRKRLGMNEDTKLDVSNIKSNKTVELQRLKALNATLQKEVESLEDERIKLKSRLRNEAALTGDRAVSMGLNAEELIAVEEYASRLRSGQKTESPLGGSLDGRPVVINGQLEKLVIELERLHVDSEESRTKISELQSQLSDAKSKNRALEAVIREVSTTFVKTRSGKKDEPEILERSLNPSQPSETKGLELIEKLVTALESKSFNEVTRDLEGDEEIEESVLQTNTILRDEIIMLKAKLDLMTKDRDSEREKATSLNEEVHGLRMKSKNGRSEILNLPPELLVGSTHDYGGIVEQLMDCLRELQVKNEELKECREALEKFETIKHHYGILLGKQRHLYRDYQTQRMESTQKIEEAEEALRLSNLARDAAEIKVKEMDKAMETLDNSTHDVVRRELIESQRRVTVLKVNELNLKRRYSALAEVEKHLRKENTKIKEDVQCLDNAARQTIGRLLRSKKELSQHLENVQKHLKASVPQADFNTVQSRLDLYQAKTRLLLDRERAWIEARERTEDEARDLEHFRRKVERLELELEEAQGMNRRLEQALKEIETTKGYNYNDKLTDALHKLARLETSQEVLHRRAELADSKWKTLEESERQLKARLNEAEQLYREASEETIQLREANVDLCNRWEGGASREEREEAIKKIEDLEKENLTLREDINQYKDLTDIAGNQAADLLHLHKMDQREKEILRAAIEELQVEGDDKLLIGKLHHHIIALQVSEATALRKLDIRKAKCMRLETSLLNAEKAVEERENTLLELRQEYRKHVLGLQKTVVDLRSRIYGHVTLDKHERTCDLLRSIDLRKSEVEKVIIVLEEEKRELQDKLAEVEFQLDSQEELVATLKKPSTASEKIVAWQTRMANTQLSNLKLSREVDLLRKRETQSQKTIDDYLQRISAMEEDIVRIQIASDGRELEWDRRQEDLERKLGMLEEEREMILKSSATADVCIT